MKPGKCPFLLQVSMEEPLIYNDFLHVSDVSVSQTTSITPESWCWKYVRSAGSSKDGHALHPDGIDAWSYWELSEAAYAL
jgi:hypothetical protein